MVTATDLASALKARKPGDVLQLEGIFPDSYRINDIDNLTLIGGTFTGRKPLVFTRGNGLTLKGQRFTGIEPRSESATSIFSVANVKVSNFTVTAYRNGLIMNDVAGFDLDGFSLSDLSADGVHCAAVRNGRIANVTVHGTRSYGAEHPDGIQLRSVDGLPPTSDVVVEDCLFVGHINGLLATDHGAGGFKNLTLRRIRAAISRTQGIGIAGADGLIMEDVVVTTLPGAEKQARIVVRECLNVTPRAAAWGAYEGRKAANFAVSVA